MGTEFHFKFLQQSAVRVGHILTIMSAGKPEVTLIIDANATNLIPSDPTQWQDSGEPFWYGKSARWAAGTSLAEGKTASFQMTFHGTSISFSGNTPIFALVHSTFDVNLDGQQASNINYPEDFVNIKWYQSPTLSDGQHLIIVSNLDKSVIDYVLVTAGDNTSLTGSTIIVDDANAEEIWYSGQWKQQTDQKVETGVNGSGTAPARPMNNTTHATSNVGDSLEFHFAGSSISVYGLLDLVSNGTVTLDFNLDGAVRRSTFPQGSDTNHLNLPNYLFFENTSLTPGNHTLLVNVTAVEGSQNFQLDYLTYKPSFSLISQKPTFGSRGSASPTGSIEPPPTAAAPQDTQSPQSRTPVGAIVGGTIGGVAFVVLLVGFLFLRRKRTKQTKPTQWTVEPFEAEDENKPPTPVEEGSVPRNEKRRPQPVQALPYTSTTPSPNRSRKQRPPTQEVTHASPSSASTSPVSSPAISPSPDSERQNSIPQSSVHPTQPQSQVPEEHTMAPARIGDLYATIDMLTRENARLMREYVLPPQYEGSQPASSAVQPHNP